MDLISHRGCQKYHIAACIPIPEGYNEVVGRHAPMTIHVRIEVGSRPGI